MREHAGLSWPHLLRTLAAADAQHVTGAGVVIEIAAGDYLFHQDDVSDSMFIVLDGEIQLSFSGVGDGKKLVPGDIVGELSLLVGRRRRTASARAAVDSRLLVLDEAAFERILKHDSRVFVTLLRTISTYLLGSERRLIDQLVRKCDELERTLDLLRRTKDDLDFKDLLTRIDDLTGLYNRRCMSSQLERLVERPADSREVLALVLVDLDGFKAINDSHGHACGDEVLRRIAATLRDAVRRNDLPCRIGGDEFAVVLPDMPAAQARERAEAIRQQIARESIDWKGAALSVSASLGGTTVVHGETATQVYERADRHLYEAKKAGRNRLVWDP